MLSWGGGYDAGSTRRHLPIPAPSSRCDRLRGGGNFFHGAASPVLMYFGGGCSDRLYRDLVGAGMHPTGWGKLGVEVPLCSIPPGFAFPDSPARSSQKLGAAPASVGLGSWEVLIPDEQGYKPPGMVLWRGGCKKKEQEARGEGGGKGGGRSQPHLAGSAEPVSLR